MVGVLEFLKCIGLAFQIKRKLLKVLKLSIFYIYRDEHVLYIVMKLEECRRSLTSTMCAMCSKFASWSVVS